MPKLKDNPKRWVPENPADVLKNEFGIVYLYQSDQGTSVMSFSGGRKDYDFYYIYPTEKMARDKATSYLDNLVGTEEFRAERRAYRSQVTTNLKIGSILYSSWGYEQTNVDWYQVVEVKPSGKSVMIRKIARTIVEDGFMSGRSTPHPGQFVGDPMLKRVRAGDMLTITSYASAFPWDGKPKYCSWYG